MIFSALLGSICVGHLATAAHEDALWDLLWSGGQSVLMCQASTEDGAWSIRGKFALGSLAQRGPVNIIECLFHTKRHTLVEFRQLPRYYRQRGTDNTYFSV